MELKRHNILRMHVVLITVSFSISIAVLPAVEYVVYESNKCHSDKAVLTTITGISLFGCVVNCVERQRCAGVSYKKRVNICDLLSTVQGGMTEGPCEYVRRSDIVVSAQSPCPACTPERACDWSTGACAVKECKFPDVTGGHYVGNRNSVGHRLGITCDDGYSRDLFLKYITCGADGEWNPAPGCVPVSRSDVSYPVDPADSGAVDTFLTTTSGLETSPTTVEDTAIADTPAPATHSHLPQKIYYEDDD